MNATFLKLVGEKKRKICTNKILGSLEFLAIKNEEASYNFKLVFALSKRPHFNSVYLVRVPSLIGIAVCTRKTPVSRKMMLGEDSACRRTQGIYIH